MATFRVAVMGSQNERSFFGGEFGVQAFDLTAEQICTLLQDKDIATGVDTAKLGAQPVMTYSVYSGGRFFPTVSREELSQTMQGVQVFIAVVPEISYAGWVVTDFLHGMTEEKMLEKCQFIVARVVSTPERRKRMGKYAPKKKSAEKHVEEHGVGKLFQDKLCIISDLPEKKSKKSAKKTKGELQGIERDIASLRLSLVGEEVRETVVQPVKETVTAGKSLLGLGQRLAGWIGGLVRAQ